MRKGWAKCVSSDRLSIAGIPIRGRSTRRLADLSIISQLRSARAEAEEGGGRVNAQK